MNYLFYLILTGVFCCISVQLFAQESPKLGSYHTITFEVPLARKCSLYNEEEFRGVGVLSKFYYYESKTGVNYKHTSRMTFTLAFGVYNTFNGGPEYDNMIKKTDFRIWQQMNYKQQFFSGVMEHRVRLEEQINKNLRPTLRYRLQPKLPLNRKTLTTGTLFATVYDELFFQFVSPAFRRNRIFGGFGYYFSKSISVQSGLLRQTDFKTGAENFAKDFFYVSGSFKL